MSTYRPGQPLLAADEPATEPVMARAIAIAFVTAALGLLVAFGVPVNDDQQAAILGLVAVAAPLVAGWLARRKVFSPATVKRLIAERPAPR